VSDWSELLSEMSPLEPPADVTEQVLGAVGREARAGGNRPRRIRWWQLARPLPFVLAALGLAAVLVVLAVAAHSRSNTPSAPAGAQLASPAKLRILREAFANPNSYHRAASIAELATQLPIAQVRPDAPLASDRMLDSVWLSTATNSGSRSITLIWKSGVVETIERWRCNCEAVTSLKQGGQRKPFRFMTLRGAPALTAPSDPAQRGERWLGPVSKANATYGVPASVETIRDGYNITFFRYGADALPGLIAAVRTLPTAQTAFDVNGYSAAGAALRNWDGAHGIDVAPLGGARFAIGVELKNVTGHPLTITGVHALNGFIKLIGTHVRAYTPPVGSAIGPGPIHPPYDATSPTLSYQLQPNRWAGLQLDFQIENPCTPWVQTIYDRTVEVTYTQDGRAHIREVPLVPLNITRSHPC
jgi:hypothetical protein